MKMKISHNYENENFAATLCRSGVRGVQPVQPWRTLYTNADCALFVFLLYCFQSVIYNSVGPTEDNKNCFCTGENSEKQLQKNRRTLRTNF